MTPKQIQDHLNRRLPHVQLRFHLTDGMTYDVTDHASASVQEYQLVIGVDPDPDGLPRRSVYIDPHHVARVETLVQSTSGGRQQGQP